MAETVQKSQAANKADTGGTTRPAPTVASVLGEICWLFSMTPSHRHFFMADLDWLVIPPVVRNQFRVYRDSKGRPVGLVLWAKLDEEAEQRLLSGSARLRPQDWDSGDRYWIIDVVDLSKGQRAKGMIEDMAKTALKDVVFKYHRTDSAGNRSVVSSDAL
ncbi:toxin-activating lysine-acyltransferase [Rhodospirillaceae bacterium KN72]|uniref:RTX toxin-activating lysine-acyltransferase n=1 Tax=Pacificispira spongiicola TaxID=2729598 RepID=A0A7Y0E197_9PROT|nr:toxin-activating lysine-acyltransferase [Pacificispira spongiicola]NMM45387.1 toxin-activating lysine-acyltransferase [Pacificispira spongiicola]